MRALRALTLAFVLVLLMDQVFAGPYESIGCPARIDNGHECSDFLERNLLKKSADTIERKGRRLTIHLENGRKKIYINKSAEEAGDASRRFAAVAHFAEVKYLLISTGFWEGKTYHLLNLINGETVHVGGWAVLSPDKQRFAVTYSDISAGYNPNVLAVYRIGFKGLEREFLASRNWGAEDAKWIDREMIAFKKHSWDADGQREERRILHLSFTGTDIAKFGKWKIR